MTSTASLVPTEPASAAGRLRATRCGRVAAFSYERGLGVVEDQEGRRFSFHCVEIADGSRRIEVGVPVVFSLGLGLGGSLEARQLVAQLS
jgi:hypothetical protein